VASFITELKRRTAGNIIKYGNGPLDVSLMANRLIDEFHLLLTRSQSVPDSTCSRRSQMHLS
jgi:hypothetical protein